MEWMALFSCMSLLALSQAKVVPFGITLTWETAAPDGFGRKVILTNGQLPGPPLYVNQGDDVEFLVMNKLPFELTIHFHGKSLPRIDQIGTPWSDGVPGISQRPIKPGQSYLYQWNANEYGSYFYHAHDKAHIDDGLFGAIYVQPASNVQKPFNLITNSHADLEAIIQAERKTQPIFLSDWTHLTSAERHAAQIATGLDSWCTNSLLINGKGSAICLDQETIEANTNPLILPFLNGITYTDLGCLPPTLSFFQGDYPHNFSAEPFGLWSGCKASQGPTEVLTVNSKDKWVSYDIISATSTQTLVFSIDEHPLWVYAIDGRYVTPTIADALTIANGQRYSVMVQLKDQPIPKYTIRAAVSGVNQILGGTAFLSYGNVHTKGSTAASSKPYITLTGANATADTIFLNESLAGPFLPVAPAKTVDATYTLSIGRANGSYLWKMENDSFPYSLDREEPLLFNPNELAKHNLSDLTIRTKNGSWVDLIVLPQGPVQPPHPLHKHSNKFYVIGSGMGTWNFSSVAEAMEVMPESFNLINPPIRDTYPTPLVLGGAEAWIVYRYQVVNPGAFLFHCHIQDHLDGGMAVALIDGYDVWPHVPEQYLRNNGFPLGSHYRA